MRPLVAVGGGTIQPKIEHNNSCISKPGNGNNGTGNGGFNHPGSPPNNGSNNNPKAVQSNNGYNIGGVTKY